MLNAASASHVRSGSWMRAGSFALRSRRYRAAPSTLTAGIHPVADAEVLRGVLGDLHQSAHAGLAGRVRVPLRLLIGDRGEQAPFDAGLLLHVVEERAPLRQLGAHVLLQRAGIDALELARVRHVALDQPADRPVALRAGEKAVEVVAKPREPRRHRPRQLALHAQRKRDLVIDVDAARGGRGQRSHDRVIDGAVGNLRDQPGGRRQVERPELDARMRGAHVRDVGGQSARVDVGNAGPVEIAPARQAGNRRGCR